MDDAYPGYDVLRKRDTPSWNDITRRVIDARLSVPREPRFFMPQEWQTLHALCDRIMPQPDRDPPIPLPCYIDQKLYENETDGYRYPGMPEQGEAWKRGLAALEEASQRDHAESFATLAAEAQRALLQQMQDGSLKAKALQDMPPDTFFSARILHDVVRAYYAHPLAWNEIGWGGPASPRGYVRLDLNEADPWEPVEAAPGDGGRARRRNRNAV